MVHKIQGRVRHSSYRKSRDEAGPQKTCRQGFSLSLNPTALYFGFSLCCCRLSNGTRQISHLTVLAFGKGWLPFYILLSKLSGKKSDWPILVQLLSIETNQSFPGSMLGQRTALAEGAYVEITQRRD